MAHQITATDHMFSGMNITPWHKLGSIVAGLLTWREAVEAARLQWVVKFADVTVNGKVVPGYQATVRQDTGEALGIMRERYEIIQNERAFEFFDHIVGQGRATYETAGSLRGGRIVWALAKYNGEIKINGDDHKQWVLMVTGHDGRYSLMLQWVTERVVCGNTLSIAMRGATNRISIKHTANWENKEDEAKRVLGLTEDYFTSLKNAMTGMNDKLLTPEQMAEFTKLLIPAKDEKDVPTRTQNVRDEVNRLFGKGAGNTGSSRWDALQAVSDYADHGSTLRGENSTRLESSLMGSAATLKQRAWDILTSEDLMAQLLAKGHGISQSVTPQTTDFARLLSI